MVMLVHLTTAKLEAKVRRGGLRAANGGGRKIRARYDRGEL